MPQNTVSKAWKINSFKFDELPRDLSVYHPVVAKLLFDRGIKSVEEADYFFNPNFERHIHDPFLFKEMNSVVDRIFFALENNEKITIHGDYDADGVSAAAVMTLVLRDILKAMNKDFVQLDFYIPHRESEGYGLSDSTVSQLKERGTNLIITVDCGIASVSAINQAKGCGIETIIIDHHEFGEVLPQAKIIHPRVPGENYPFKFLSATGVAWKVACALYSQARSRGLAVSAYQEKWLLDLVAIATITDIMPIVGENRTLEFFGLKVLQKTKRIGLKKLYKIAGINQEKIDSYSIGFQIGPRINAAGRMEHAEVAFRLLITDDEIEAEALAKRLHDQNNARQFESNRMFEAARLQALELKESKIVYAIGEGWSAGLVGLVAGKLVQEFARPALVMGRSGEKIVGSGRSVQGFHITEALQGFSQYLDHFGGHPQACGFTIFGEEKYAKFINGMKTTASDKLSEADFTPFINIDAEVLLSDISLQFAKQVLAFEPHGEGNPSPLFVTKNLTLDRFDFVGENNRHLRIFFKSDDGKKQKFIGFGWADRIELLKSGKMLDVVYKISLNEWNGNEEVQLRLVDARISIGQ